MRLALSMMACLAAVGSASARDLITDTPAPRLGSLSDLLRIKPVPLPMAPPGAIDLTAPDTPALLPGEPTASMEAGSRPSQRAHGTFGIPYTSTRVILGTLTAPNATRENMLSASYPYRMVGKLVSSKGSCSASVIKRGIIVTAAHCIQAFGSGVTAPLPSFAFIPGHYFSSTTTQAQWAPYGTWTSRTILRPLKWATGQDKGCGAIRENDIALIALNTLNGRLIGDVVGQFGIAYNNYGVTRSAATGNRNVASVTSLGYPSKSDGGNVMQRVDGPAYLQDACTAPNLVPTMVRGSDLTQGASGGPWVLNFKSAQAVYTAPGSPGTDAAMVVTGVTSFGSVDGRGQFDGTSRFGQTSAYPLASYGVYGAGNIGSMLNDLCSFKPSGQTKTYAQLGYCD